MQILDILTNISVEDHNIFSDWFSKIFMLSDLGTFLRKKKHST